MKNRRIFTTVCMALGLLSCNAQDSCFEDSITWGIISAPQVEQFVGMANRGHSVAQYYVGRCYFNGYHLPKDKYKAVEFWSKAAEKEQSEALYYMGHCYKYGFGVEKNEARSDEMFKKAVKWLEQETDKDIYAAYYLALCYSYGFGVPVDHPKSFDFFEKAAEKGNSQALVELGLAHLHGNNVNKDAKKAVEYFNKAAEMGIPYLGTVRQGIAIKEAAALQRSLYQHAPRSKPAADYMDIYQYMTNA